MSDDDDNADGPLRELWPEFERALRQRLDQRGDGFRRRPLGALHEQIETELVGAAAVTFAAWARLRSVRSHLETRAEMAERQASVDPPTLEPAVEAVLARVAAALGVSRLDALKFCVWAGAARLFGPPPRRLR